MHINVLIEELSGYKAGDRVCLVIKEGSIFPVRKFSQAVKFGIIPVVEMTKSLVYSLSAKLEFFRVNKSENFPVIIIIDKQKPFKPGSRTYELLEEICGIVTQTFVPLEYRKVA